MLISILIFLLGIAGAILCSYGAWLIDPPLGFITLGVFLMIASYMYAKAYATKRLIDSQQARDD